MYQNFMEQIDLSSAQIESKIKTMNLIFPGQKDDKMEWKTMPPMFISSFYEYVALNNTIPSQKEFWDFYYQTNKNNFQNYILENINFLKARCYRAYPSFIRDIHFYYIMVESKLFDNVFYHPDVDIKYGIDFVLKYKKIRFGINCFINTSRSHQGRAKKIFRHPHVKSLALIDLPVDFSSCKKCGRFFLYSNRELLQLKELLEKK